MRAHGKLALMAIAAIVVALGAAGPAAAHGLSRQADRYGTVEQELPEARLFEIEKATLGLEHAREHALGRKLAREGIAEGRGARRLDSSGTVFSRELGAAERGVTRAVDGPANLVGRWQPPFSIPVMAINAALLPTGKVLWFAYPVNANPIAGGPDVPNEAQAWLWDSATGQTKRVDPPLWLDPKDGKLKPANIWCGGTSFLADGRVVVAGGSLDYRRPGVEFKGLEKVYTFDPYSETWTEQPDMEHGRWYPSQARLADGRTVILSGLDESGRTDIYPTNKSIEVLNAADESNLRGVGTLDRLNGLRGDRDMPPDGGLYPHTFWMPSGRLLVAGPDENDSWFLNGADPDQPLSGQWDWFFPQQSRQRLFGTGVQLPNEPGTGASTRFMQIGGWSDALSPGNTATTETLDETTVVPRATSTTWQTDASSLNVPRSHANTVLLPDGSMVEIGGGWGKDQNQDGDGQDEEQWSASPEHKTVELWDPDTGVWTEGPAQQEYRTYHSTALLLPDGRVVSAGDDLNGGYDRDSAEIYEPPYLFKGPRPVISSAPKLAVLGQTLDVATPDPALIDHAALVAPGATTHANDMNQRYFAVAATPGAGKVSIALPASVDELLPGWYMLFLLSDAGVPSVASWVRIGPAGTPSPGELVIEQQASPQDGTRFGFTGAPFVDFDLAAGESRSVTVMAGTYELTQGATPSGYHPPAVSCDDAVLSPSSVAPEQRRATVHVSPGEIVRCTFSNSKPIVPDDRRLIPPEPPRESGPAPDTTAPRARVSGLNRRTRRLHGTVRDASAVRRVDVALGRKAGRRCRWWSRRAKALGAPRSCRRPVLMRTMLRPALGGAAWSVRLGRLPAAGRYRVVIRSRDALGNVRSETKALSVQRAR